MTNVKRWLPSRSFAVVLITLVVLVGAGSVLFVYQGGDTQSQPTTPEEIQAGVVAARSDETLDSDGDGLKDWEEVLWKSDPHNPDSDGDGTDDGDEVRDRRDPALAGPGDSLQLETQSGISNTGVSFQELTRTRSSAPTSQTEELSRNLFAAYLDGRQGGSTLDPQTLAAHVIQTLQTNDVASTPRYTVRDISVVPQKDTATLRSYANAVGNVFQGAATKENNELLALEAFAQTGDPSQLNLEPVARAYETRAALLKNISVPSPLVIEHLTMLNALAGIGESMRSFAFLGEDPLRALVALQSYEAYSGELQRAVGTVGAFLGNAGIVFAGNEPGIVLTL